MRGIDLDPDSITAEVEGLHDIRDRLPVLTEVVVRYTLRIPSDAEETVQRALERHQSKCPTAATLSGAVDVRWEADVQIVEDA